MSDISWKFTFQSERIAHFVHNKDNCWQKRSALNGGHTHTHTYHGIHIGGIVQIMNMTCSSAPLILYVISLLFTVPPPAAPRSGVDITYIINAVRNFPFSALHSIHHHHDHQHRHVLRPHLRTVFFFCRFVIYCFSVCLQKLVFISFWLTVI